MPPSYQLLLWKQESFLVPDPHPQSPPFITYMERM